MEQTYLIIGFISCVIFGFFGYMLGKKNQKPLKDDYSSCKSDLEVSNQKNSQLQLDIEALRTKLNNSAKKTTSNLVIEPKNKETALFFDADVAKATFGKKINEDDLKIIEGIGPKIEELFKTSGILTWKSLSETSVDRCNKILDKAGDRYRIHNPETWPRQAKLAYLGNWVKLKKWQEELDGGKEKK
jgi:predicted flap endonuclease-1-like 5' DNA nuclease